MKIEPNSVVSLTYELRVEDQQGEEDLIETVEADQPMVFLYGLSGLPPQFEAEIEGMQTGDEFKFTIAPEEGYGKFDPDAVVDLPLSLFVVDGQVDPDLLQEGNLIPMTDNEGNHLQGRVMEVGDENVKMDFNHPLVGKSMYFKGQITGVRSATAEEIAHGHAHGEGGHAH